MNPDKKKVLIALDYAETAQKVAEIGFSFAQSMEAEAILVHVYVDLVYYSPAYLNMGPLQSDGVVQIQDISQHFLDKMKQHLCDETIKTIVLQGDVAESILKTAKEQSADIIVIGSHSRKWLENIVMGSVAEKILRQSNNPIFVVPTKKPI